MKENLTAITYHFLLEFILASLFLFIFHISFYDLPPFLIFFSLSFGGFMSFIFLLDRFGGKGNLYFFFTVFPLFILLGVIAGWRLITMIIFGIIVFWRGKSLYVNHSVQNNAVYLFYSFMLAIWLIIYSGIKHYPFQTVIITLLIMQIVLVLAGLFFSRWHTVKEFQREFILYYGRVIGGTVLIGAIITLGLKLVQLTLGGILLVSLKGFSYLAAPILNILQSILKLVGIKGESSMQGGNGNGRNPLSNGFNLKSNTPIKPETVHEKVNKIANSSLHMWLLVLLVVVALFVVFYIYKKRRIRSVNNERISKRNKDGTLDDRGVFFKTRAKPPEDLIRSEVFYLEKFAHKMKLGRRPFESLTEWWKRIGISESGEISRIYQNIRYGESPSTEEDLAQVKGEITLIKKQIIAKSENK